MKGLKGFSQVRQSGERKRILGDISFFNFGDYAGEKLVFRLLGPIRGYSTHWIEINTKSGKHANIPKLCLNYDADTDSFADNNCPYCNLNPKAGRKYLVNAIFRREQEKEPKKVTRTEKEEQRKTIFEDYKCYIKDPKSSSWTPVVVLNLPYGVVQELKDLGANNTGDDGECHDVNDVKYGMDISIRYNPEKAGESKYRVDSLKVTPLTKEERKYLIFDIDNIPMETLAEAKEEYKKLKQVAVTNEDEDVDSVDYEDDEEDEKPKKKSKKKSFDDDDDVEDFDEPKSKKKKYDEDDDDDEEEDESDDEDSDDEDFDDEDEDEKPSKKKKSKRDDDDDDDDEDEKPVKKKKKPSKHDEDEDDDDFDDFDDDEDEDEKPKKKSKKSKRKDDDEDDDDDWD